MKTKLTLSVTAAIIRRGKLAAENRGTSLSELVAEFIEGLDLKLPTDDLQSPYVANRFGSYRLPAGISSETVRFQTLLKKHLS